MRHALYLAAGWRQSDLGRGTRRADTAWPGGGGRQPAWRRAVCAGPRAGGAGEGREGRICRLSCSGTKSSSSAAVPRRWRELLALTDLLIDDRMSRNSRITAGRGGVVEQEYHFLTDRYRDLEPRFGDTNRVEVRISPDGRILMNGMGRLREIEHDLFEGVARRAPGQGRRAAGPGSRGAA